MRSKIFAPTVIAVLSALIVLTFSCRKSNYILEESDFIITDDGTGTGTVTWHTGKNYLLEGFVFVNDGQVLTIEPGTIIRGKSGRAGNASALIVARGAKIIAEGTREQPIIFTSENDDLKGSVSLDSRGLWGGVILLGDAPVASPTGESTIEGLPYYEPRGTYGGFSPEDNSGILKYVSIRHGGSKIGEDNEINGLTMGGVGSGTEIDYVEIIANEDDGLEIFGGTVNIKHIFIAFCGDDAYDFDLGYSGKGQFLVGIQDDGLGDRLIEIGGGQTTSSINEAPIFHNLTLIGQNTFSGRPLMSFLQNAAGKFFNSIYLRQSGGIELENIQMANSSYDQWKAGNILIENSWFYDIAGNNPSDIFYLSGGFSPDEQEQWANYFQTGNNLIRETTIGRSNGKYQLLSADTEWDALYPYSDSWFDEADFKGAMGPVNWAKGWTLFDEAGLFIEDPL